MSNPASPERFLRPPLTGQVNCPRNPVSATRCSTGQISLSLLNLVHQQRNEGMRIVNVHEAKTHLSRLLDQAAKGEPFIIAKAGKPLVKVMAVDAPEPQHVRRLGF